MPTHLKEIPCPLEASLTIQKYFIENRSRLLDLAAYLDRIDRSLNSENAKSDFRIIALHKAIEALLSSNGPRVDRLHEILSDQNLEPLGSLPSQKSASGAPTQLRSSHHHSCC